MLTCPPKTRRTATVSWSWMPVASNNTAQPCARERGPMMRNRTERRLTPSRSRTNDRTIERQCRARLLAVHLPQRIQQKEQQQDQPPPFTYFRGREPPQRFAAQGTGCVGVLVPSASVT